MTLARAKKYLEYCRRDTEITGKFVKTMLKKYSDIGVDARTTIAATTLHFFETHFYRKVTHQFTEEQIQFFHLGYYGGRTEIFHNRPLKGPIYYHDLNSLYPYCMRTGKFPVLETFYETKRPQLRFEGMADVTIIAPKLLKIPYLSCKAGGKLVFPLGTWRGVYTFFELREAKKLGYRIAKTHRAIEFPYTFNPFKEFIDTLWAERLKSQREKDDLMSLVWKSFLNFCYGKFAQGNETTELVPLSSHKGEIPEGSVIYDGELLLLKRKKKYPRYANCIWANYVTAYARDRLYKHGFQRIEKKGGYLVYCDTDSVMYRSEQSLIEHSTSLGEFKLEGIYREAYYKLPKLYYLLPYKKRSKRGQEFARITLHESQENPQYKAKGVPHAVAARFFKENHAEYLKPNKLKETLRRNSAKTRKRLLIPNFWETRKKELTGKYTKRKVLKDGSTIPLILTGREK